LDLFVFNIDIFSRTEEKYPFKKLKIKLCFLLYARVKKSGDIFCEVT